MNMMGTDNGMRRETYVLMMAHSLKRKLEVLDELLRLTKQQAELLSSDKFLDEQFETIVSLKDGQIEILTQLDNGFEQLYERVKEELENHREIYASEIADMQDKIVAVTNASVKLQAMEKRNQLKAREAFSQKRRYIKNARISNETAANYYNTMTKQHNVPSFFYDKKN
jgi:uncharacterized protein YecA (UPF0149 family)